MRWRNSEGRLPLLIRGVRQCGKTHLMKRFGEDNYRRVAYFNFEDSRSLHRIFDESLEPGRLIPQLSIQGNVTIDPEDTLIVFDEIQACRRALTSLKYFSEDAPEYHVICAGSLLGIHLGTERGDDGTLDSFPVGRVQIMDLYPMDFEEYLLACGEGRVVEFLKGLGPEDDVPGNLVAGLESRLREYYVVGGMPDVVSTWLRTRSIVEVRRAQDRILETFHGDLSKHPVDARGTLEAVWDSVPQQLLRDSGRFVFGRSVKGARGMDLEAAVLWLERAGMVYRVRRIERPSIPVSMHETTSYKLYMCDVGLLSCRSGVPPSFINTPPEEYKDLKEAMAESYVLQQLVVGHGRRQWYWRSDGIAEVEFVCPVLYEPVPIEVKAGHARKSKSLSSYMGRYSPRVAIKTSLDPEVGGNGVTHVPLYLMWDLDRRVRAALERGGWRDPDEAFDAGDLGYRAHAVIRVGPCP